MNQITSLGLPRGTAIKAILADGKDVLLDTFTCQLDWFGETKTIEVIANEGNFPLLGFGLLVDRQLTIDYRSRTLTLD